MFLKMFTSLDLVTIELHMYIAATISFACIYYANVAYK